ncbi:MAG TPA: hypothetical protein VF160_01210 [Candidatus Dormibacteraeota bacterium]
MAAYLANVGVNASHRVHSPIHPDGSFRLLPIPETVPWAPPMLRLPEAWGPRAVHLDPDLAPPHPTYGDNCRRAGRAFSLRRAEAGDLIVFLARLRDGGGSAALHLVGALEIADLLADVTQDPGPGWWDANAHIRRARATRSWDSFWVFRGGPATRLFGRAQLFTLEVSRTLLGMQPNPRRSQQQTIASHTRAVRRLTGAAEDMLRGLCDGS